MAASGTMPVDSISFDPTVTFADGNFTITGQVSSSVGVASVRLSGLKNVSPVTLGGASVDASGLFSFVLPLGKDSYDSISAVETDDAGKTKTAQANFDLEGGAVNRPYVAVQESFTSLGERTTTNYFRTDGSVQETMVYGPMSAIEYSKTNNDDGTNTILVQSTGLSIPANFFDTIQNGGRPDNTFVFSPNHGLDIVQQFRGSGADHDTLSLQGSDFGNSIATVLRDTRQLKGGGSLIMDPTTGDTIRLVGVSKKELIANQGDLTFHA